MSSRLPTMGPLRGKVAGLAAVTGVLDAADPHAAAQTLLHPSTRANRLIWIYGVGMLAFSLLTSILALWLEARFDVTASTIGYFFVYTGGLSLLMRSVLLGPIIDRLGEINTLRFGAVVLALGLLLLGWAAYHALYGARHRVRFGMTVGYAGLAAWSFLMASAHGAGLMLIPVVLPPGADPAGFEVADDAYTGPGQIYNSNFLDGLEIEAAKAAAIARVEADGRGEGATIYRLRDWGVSRQRYWGCPIPIIHCDACGPVPVPADQLPVALPEDVTFDVPGNPLDRHPSWKHVACPSCGAAARRETDTLDTFVDSSWYFARFANPAAPGPIDKAAANRWLPVDQYIGGVEHA